MDLLEKASIILTPTAYNNGEALCVKPSDGSGDFDFSRNSAATRVNAQGLVENVQILSSNLVQNGDFSEEGTEKISNGSFSQEGTEQADDSVISNDGNAVMTKVSALNYNATSDGTGGSTIRPRLLFNNTPLGKNYRLIIKPTNQSGTINFKLYNGSSYLIDNNDLSSDIDFYFSVEGGAQVLIAFDGTEAFNVDFEISLKEVGQDWVLDTGWSIGVNSAIYDGITNVQDIRQEIAFQSGKTYKINFTISDVNEAEGEQAYFALWALSNGSESIFTYTKFNNGTYTFYYTAVSGNIIMFNALNSSNGGSFALNNISVKEVGQNWNFDANWSIGNNKAISTGSGRMFQSIPFLETNVGTKVKVSFDIVDYTSAGVVINCYGGVSSLFQGVGSYSFITTTTNSLNLYVNNAGQGNLVGSITNLSVIAITEDTNLPRINYEGFSYQDALGSELVDYSTLTSGSSSWSLVDGLWVFDDTANGFLNTPNIAVVVGDKYKVVVDVTISSGNANFRVASGNSQTLLFNYTDFVDGVNEFEATVTGVDGVLSRIFAPSSLTDNPFTLNSISIKKINGQEPIPNSGCGHWLFEPQSTNLIEYSNDYTDAYWIKATSGSGIAPVVTSNYAISPDGTQNADRIQFDATTSGSNADRSRIRTTLSLTDTSYYTFSFYAKSTDGRDQNIGVLFDNSQISTFTITDEWQRFEVTQQQIGTSSICGLDLRSGNAFTSDILVYGIQVEEQSYATSYIPTSGSTVTRVGETCVNATPEINSEEGVLYFEGSGLFNGGSNRIISLSDETNDNLVQFRYDTTANRITSFIRGNGGSYAIKTINGFNQANNNKVALVWNATSLRVWINGTESGSVSTNDLPIAMDTLSFTQPTGGASTFYGNTKDIQVFTEALSDYQLAQLTTI